MAQLLMTSTFFLTNSFCFILYNIKNTHGRVWGGGEPVRILMVGLDAAGKTTILVCMPYRSYRNMTNDEEDFPESHDLPTCIGQTNVSDTNHVKVSLI